MTTTVFVDAATSLRSRKHAATWHVFVAVIALVTVIPFLIVPYSQHGTSSPETAMNAVVVLNFLGANFHVASSAWFYTDPTMRAQFRSRRWRYLVVPALLIAGSATAFHFASPALRGYMLVAFFSWQIWHYQKQNVGLLSFVAAGTDSGPLSLWERRTLMLAAVAGMLGFFEFFNFIVPSLSVEFASLHRVGALVYLLVPVAFGVALLKSPALRANRLRIAFLALGASFFLPTYIFPDSISATLGYAVAHGLQYVVFMAVVSVGRPNPIASAVMLVGMATLGALALNAAIVAPAASDFAYGYLVYGAFVGVVMAHFVVDAGIWRLREPFQRAYMRSKFYFVFDR